MTIAAFVAVVVIATRPPTDTDTWWHIRSGAWTLTHGFIYADPFSHTRADVVWINHSWGAQVALWGVYQLAGEAGLALYTTTLAAVGMGFLWAAGSGSAYVRGFVLVLASATAAVFWSARPQMLTFALSAITLWVLWALLEHRHDRTWWLVPLLWAWGNLHAGFSIGFILIGGAVAGGAAERLLGHDGALSWAQLRKLVVVGLAGVAVLVVNPYGPRLLLVPFQTIGLATLGDFIQEWNPPDFHNPQFLPFIVLLAALIALVGASPRRLRPTHIVLLSGTLYLALTGARNVALFATVAAPVLMAHADALLRERGGRARPLGRVPFVMGVANALLAGLLVGGGLALVAGNLAPARVAAEQAAVLPVAAADYLRAETPPGRLFNSYNWGGYLMFAVPHYPVFVDGRTDLYGDAFLREYLQIYTASGDWAAALDRYDVNLIVVERGSPLAAAVAANGWQLAHQDDIAVVYTRNRATMSAP